MSDEFKMNRTKQKKRRITRTFYLYIWICSKKNGGALFTLLTVAYTFSCDKSIFQFICCCCCFSAPSPFSVDSDSVLPYFFFFLFCHWQKQLATLSYMKWLRFFPFVVEVRSFLLSSRHLFQWTSRVVHSMYTFKHVAHVRTCVWQFMLRATVYINAQRLYDLSMLNEK